MASMNTLHTDYDLLNKISLFQIITIGSIVALYVNMLSAIKIIGSKEYIEQLILFIPSSSILLGVIIYIFSDIFNSNIDDMQLIADKSLKKTILLFFLILVFLIIISMINSDFANKNFSDIHLINGIHSLGIVLYVIVALAITYPIWLVYKRMLSLIPRIDRNGLSGIE